MAQTVPKVEIFSNQQVQEVSEVEIFSNQDLFQFSKWLLIAINACFFADIDIFADGVFYYICRKCHFLVGTGYVFEGEVGEAILVACAHIEEVVAVHADVLHRDVVALAQRHVLSVARLEELSPWTNGKETSCGSADIVDCDILVMLRCVGTQFEP